MAKPKAPASSPFDALVGARRQREATEANEMSDQLSMQTVKQLDVQVAKQLAKSVDPEYVKFTTYIRKTTHKSLKVKALQQGRELSDLIEELVHTWLADGA
jgi:hypothetical protein